MPKSARYKPRQSVLAHRTNSPKKPGKIIRKAIWFLILLGSIGIVLIGLLRLPAFAIKQVERVGAFEYQGFEQDINDFKGKNILLFQPAKEANKLEKKYPQILNITIKKVWPSSVTVLVNQRLPLSVLGETLEIPVGTSSATQSATITKITKSYYIDQAAVPFIELNESELNQFALATKSAVESGKSRLPLVLYTARQPIIVGKQITDRYISQVLQFIATYRGGDVVSVKRYDADSGMVYLQDGVRILFSLTKPVDLQVSALQTILESTTIERKKILVIDVRFENPVITKR